MTTFDLFFFFFLFNCCASFIEFMCKWSHLDGVAPKSELQGLFSQQNRVRDTNEGVIMPLITLTQGLLSRHGELHWHGESSPVLLKEEEQSR